MNFQIPSERNEYRRAKIIIKLQLKFVKGPWIRKTAFNINHVPRIRTKEETMIEEK